jgi:hypothetical protein
MAMIAGAFIYFWRSNQILKSLRLNVTYRCKLQQESTNRWIWDQRNNILLVIRKFMV